jgi:hypothetical protein
MSFDKLARPLSFLHYRVSNFEQQHDDFTFCLHVPLFFSSFPFPLLITRVGGGFSKPSFGQNNFKVLVDRL